MPDDDELASSLGRIMAETDQPDEQIIQVAEDAWHWRAIARDLATLTYDSADPELAAAARGADTVRRLSFEQAGRNLDVELGDATVTVFAEPDGHLIRCSDTDGDRWMAPLADGQATGPQPPNGPIRLSLATPSGEPLMITPWFLA